MARKKNRDTPVQRGLAVEGDSPVRPLAILAVVALLGAIGAAYFNSLDGAFQFDDEALLVDVRFKNPWPLWKFFNGPRPVVDLTLAVNYAISGLNPKSYHVFNGVVHALAAMTLFGLVWRILKRSSKAIQTKQAISVAFAAALLWAVHPLNTQAVTYVIQRSESMMGLCYLLTLYGLLRGAQSNRATAWFVCSVAACALGMATKAVMVTAPVVALLFDRAFIASQWREVIQRRWPVHLALFSTWSVLALVGVFQGVIETAPQAKSTVGFGVGNVTAGEYALTQAGVVLHYLRLAFWPDALCFDYFGWPLSRSVSEAAVPLFITGFLLFATVLACLLKPKWGFLGAAFFLVLAPTSSVIPIQDVAFEHRMYLSLAALVVLVVALGYFGIVRWAPPAAIVVIPIAVALGFATYQRNKLYADPITLWRDVATKQPGNARAQNNLGQSLLVKADPSEARDRVDPIAAPTLNSVKGPVDQAEQLEAQGRFEEVLALYRKAVELQPGLVIAHYNLANCLYQRFGIVDEAIAEYREAQRVDPSYIEPYIMLGNLFADQERDDEAINEFQTAIAAAGPQTSPLTLAKAHYNLGNSLAKNGRNDLAIVEYEQTLTLNPKHFEAQYGIGYAHARMGNVIDAINAYRAALAINPNYGPAREALEQTAGEAPPPGTTEDR